LEEEFEDAKGVIRIRITVYRRRTENIMAKGKGAKGQTTIYKTENHGEQRYVNLEEKASKTTFDCIYIHLYY
jgi:hypothetical protein